MSDSSVGCDFSLNDEPVWNNKFLASLVYSANIFDKVKLSLGKQQHVFVNDIQTVEMPEEIARASLVLCFNPPFTAAISLFLVS